MKVKPKEPPQIAVKFANMMFVLLILLCVLTVVFASYRIFNPIYAVNLGDTKIEIFYIISILCGSVFAVLFGLGLKGLSNNLKVDLSVLFFTVGITVYGFETYLEFFKKTYQKNPQERKIQREIIAKQMGISFDTRTNMEVLEDLRTTGVEAFPEVNPSLFRISDGIKTRKDRIYPLGGISNKTIVFCNESGFMTIYESDEYGFNNPTGLYKENNVDIVLTGDSFTEGACVKPTDTVSAVLRKLDFNAISIGKAGNGPLIELAALKEYAEPLKPKIILWMYYMNDFVNLDKEIKSPILKKYLTENNYSQNLISRQKEIDGMLVNYVEVEWEKERERREKERERREKVKREREWLSENPAIRIIKLRNLRTMINLIPNSSAPTHPPIFREILLKSKQMVSGWGGKMYFVYLPAFDRYSLGVEEKYHDFVMQTATELDIPIIDIHNEVFELHSDPLSLFPFRMRNLHYNAKGYKLIAEAIGKRLEADNYVSIKSKE